MSAASPSPPSHFQPFRCLLPLITSNSTPARSSLGAIRSPPVLPSARSERPFHAAEAVVYVAPRGGLSSHTAPEARGGAAPRSLTPRLRSAHVRARRGDSAEGSRCCQRESPERCRAHRCSTLAKVCDGNAITDARSPLSLLSAPGEMRNCTPRAPPTAPRVPRAPRSAAPAPRTCA